MTPTNSAASTVSRVTEGAAVTPAPPELSVRTVGTGPAVGWVHGYTMSSAVFDDIWPRLPDFRHIGIDLPGHGGTPAWPAQSRLSDMASALAQVLAREQVTSLVAMSMGTMVAFEMVIRRLHPLQKLAVVAPALVGMPPGAGTAQQYRTMAAMRTLGLSSKVLARAWLSAPSGIFAGLRGHPAALAAMTAVVAQHSWAELDSGGPAAFFRDPQSASDLPGSAEQLLVVTGGRDMPEFRDLAAGIIAQVPDAREAHFAEAGHLPLLEQPDLVVPALARFLRQSGGTGINDFRSAGEDDERWDGATRR